jgi:hypothetical protein
MAHKNIAVIFSRKVMGKQIGQEQHESDRTSLIVPQTAVMPLHLDTSSLY